MKVTSNVQFIRKQPLIMYAMSCVSKTIRIRSLLEGYLKDERGASFFRELFLLFVVCVSITLFLACTDLDSRATPAVDMDTSFYPTHALPLRVAVALPEPVKNYMYRGVDNHSDYRSGRVYHLAIGESLAKLLRQNLPMFFEQVDFVDESSIGGSYDLVLTPAVLFASTEHGPKTVRKRKLWWGEEVGETYYDISARIHYQLTLSSPMGEFRTQVYHEATSSREIRYVAFITDYAKVMAKAEEQVFVAVMQELLSIREFKEYVTLAKERRTLPAALVLHAEYSDKHLLIPNNFIDAGEECIISVEITNKGKGTAFDVKMNTECDFSCVDFDKVIDVGDIPPGESRTLKVKLYGRLDLKDGTALLLLQCIEKRGFDSEKIKLSIPTAHLEKPDLVIVDYKINDGNTGLASGNGNGIPENGETIELTAFVKNNGVGRAIKVDLSIASINSGLDVIRKQTEIAQILPGQTISGKLAFVIPRTYSGGDIRIALKASDVRGASDGLKQLALNLNTIRPILAYSYNITDSNGNGFVENGEACELEIRVANKGQMGARAVSINVHSADLSFSRNRTELGRLETSSTNIPTRFFFTVPRTLEKESVDVKIQLTQAEFPGLTENINVPIKVSRPEFAISHQILDPNGNGVIEQGESVELVVRVKNTGQLDAADVNLSINIDQKGVMLTSAKEFSIGRIQSGRESDPITFMITVQRSVSAGDLPVNFKITQKDFKTRDLVLALNIAPEKAKEITVAGQRPASDYRPVSPASRFKMAPHVVITTPRDGKRVVTNTIDLRGIAADDRGVVSIDINVNGKRIDLHDRAIAVKGENTQRELQQCI